MDSFNNKVVGLLKMIRRRCFPRKSSQDFQKKHSIEYLWPPTSV